MTDVMGSLTGQDLGLTAGLTKTSLVPTTDGPQKAKDFATDQEFLNQKGYFGVLRVVVYRYVLSY